MNPIALQPYGNLLSQVIWKCLHLRQSIRVVSRSYSLAVSILPARSKVKGVVRSLAVTDIVLLSVTNRDPLAKSYLLIGNVLWLPLRGIIIRLQCLHDLVDAGPGVVEGDD